jgi:dephospho-coA kinase
MHRDNITREAALQWITKQLNQDEVIAKADFELVNDGIKDVEIQLNEILSKIQE